MASSLISIITPRSGGTYPIINPRCRLQSAYIHFSFGVNSGGDATVSWGIARKTKQKLGSTKIYHDMIMQFTYKLAPGTYVFWVECKKGGVTSRKAVKFKVA